MPENKQEYVPDYDATCDNCGACPVVTIEENGKRIKSFEMCGACTFGAEACIDPEEW